MKNLFSKWWFWIFVIVPILYWIFWYFVLRKMNAESGMMPVTNNPQVIPFNNVTSQKELPPSDIIDAYADNGRKLWYSPSTSFYYLLDSNGTIITKGTNESIAYIV